MVPVAQGEASPFETDVWLDAGYCPAYTGSSMRRLSWIGNNLFLRLPRLIRLVRILRNDPAKQDVAQEAVGLATKLSMLKDPAAETDLLHTSTVKITKTMNVDDARISNVSFGSSSGWLWMGVAVKYWKTMIVLNRLCVRLSEITTGANDPHPAMKAFDVGLLRAENKRFATNIMMSWPYIFTECAAVVGIWCMHIGLLAAWAVFVYPEYSPQNA